MVWDLCCTRIFIGDYGYFLEKLEVLGFIHYCFLGIHGREIFRR